MTTEQTANETAAEDITFYVNMDFSKLANDINNGDVAHQFNGKGRKVTYLTAEQESTYFYYSSDSAGEDKITPPFEMSDGDTVTCTLQPWNNGDSSDGTMVTVKATKPSSNGKTFCKIVLIYIRYQQKIKRK